MNTFPRSIIPSAISLLLGASTLVGCGSDGGASPSGAMNVYVAGESIERRNRWVGPPFTADGALEERGGGALRNDNEEYGWMVPFLDRMALRAPDLALTPVGAETWLDADDMPYDGTYPDETPGATSAISGTDIGSWLEQRKGELEAKTFCYDIAFAARGGNDFGNEDDADFTARLQGLVRLLASGSSCRPDPLIIVTGHLPDDQRGGSGDPPDADYIALQKHRFVDRTRAAVTALGTSDPDLRVRFADMYTPFLDNRASTAFPDEIWATGGVLDFAKITRTGDSFHPRRLASIFAGEALADALDLAELL